MALRRRALVVGGALAMAPLGWLYGCRRQVKGTLSLDPTRTLAVPPGFRVTILERVGAPMSDGARVPALPDAMGAFAGEAGQVVLMRNHEAGRDMAMSGLDLNRLPEQMYDRGAAGGVTRLVVGPDLKRVTSHGVLAGTLRNCAGGVSPWGWLSCEESVEPGHGYVFLCPKGATRLTSPQRLTAYGRFNHEAACVDPATHIAYLTEDRPDGCLYRFVPRERARPFEGVLQALRVIGQPARNTGEGLAPGQRLAVDWVEAPEPEAEDDGLRLRSRARGACTISRGEGLWFHDGRVYFAATSGGPNGTGQIFCLRDTRSGEADLTLLAQSTSADELDGPDNITVAPWGDVIIAEDGRGEQYLRGLTRAGKLYNIARNALSEGELAGVCFSPDGRTLFLNLQHDGLTVALSGPWRDLAPA